MIKDFGKLQAGDVIIQNSANSAVGQAVIQIAKAWGYKTINIIRNRPNVEHLTQELYKLGADLVLTEDEMRLPATKTKIKALGPIKLGLNGVGGQSALNMARLLADHAYFVTYGGMSKEPVTIPTSLYIFKNLTCVGFWLNKWQSLRPPQSRLDMYRDILELIRQGKFKEPFHQTLSLQSSEAELVQEVDQSFTTPGNTIFVP